jgi:hypothetical protein
MTHMPVNTTLIGSADPLVASLASQGLYDPASLSLDEVRAICATALTRVPDHRRQEILAARPAAEQIDMELAISRYCAMAA